MTDQPRAMSEGSVTRPSENEGVEFRVCPIESRQSFYMSAGGGVLGAAYLCWSQDWHPLIGVCIAAVVAGLSWVYIGARSQSTSVQLRIDAAGLHADAMEPSSVAWSRVTRIDFVRPYKAPLTMRVFLDDPSAAGPPAKGFFEKLYRHMQMAAINLPIEDLEGDQHSIAAAIARFSPGTRVDL